MKKLMIAAAIVCAAAFVQASTFTWSCTKVYKEGTQTGVSGVAYLFGATQPIGEEGAPVTLTSAMIISALEGAGAQDVNTWLDGVTKYTTAVSSGTMTDMTTKPDVSLVGLTANGTSQTLFALVFDTDTVTDKSNFYVADLAKTVPASGNAAYTFGAQGNTSLTGKSQVSGAWHAVNVPEPTSGLLLVLGMAGLALRRRRA